MLTFYHVYALFHSGPPGVQTEDFSAVAGKDFIRIDIMLTFDPWVTLQEVKITLVNDDTLEPHATFFIVIADVTGGLAAEPNRANVALWDDDSKLE